MVHLALTVGITLGTISMVFGIELHYSCNPSGSITVDNPNQSLFVNALAVLTNGDLECTVLPTFNRQTFVIVGCPISHNISFTLMTTAGIPDIITGEMGFYIIRCQQIPATGVYRMVTDESWVTNEMSTYMPPSVTPTIILETEFQDIESGFKRTSAIVGEPLRWEIATIPGYIALPLNCTALSSVGDEELNIVVNGCSLDSYLLTHFDYESPSERHILVAELYAFRFASSLRTLFKCQMLGCKDGTTACDFTCPGDKKKRSVDGDGRATTSPIGSTESGWDEKPVEFDIVLKATLSVFEPYAKGSAATTVANSFFISIGASLCVFWCVKFYHIPS